MAATGDPRQDAPGNRKALRELEARLRDLSHSDEALDEIRRFAEGLGKTKDRQAVFNAPGALVREPILYEDVRERGLIDAEEDEFTLLQGDVVLTSAAFFAGERIENGTYVIATSTCDLVQGRRKHAALFRLYPVRGDDPNAKSLIGQTLKFRSTKRMYLPALPHNTGEVLCNIVEFDGIANISLDDLHLATRLASLTLVGWRVFGSMVRGILVRTVKGEVRMRSSLAQTDETTADQGVGRE